MSRVKKSSGREYHRLSQTAESDDEVVLYSLSPSSGLTSLQPRAATTEFGSGRYDKSTDLQLPSPPPRRGRKTAAARSRARSRGKLADFRWRFSRETRACVCFLALFAVAVTVVVLASSRLGVFSGTGLSETSQAAPVTTTAATTLVVTPTPTPQAAGGSSSPLPTPLPHTEHTATPPSEEVGGNDTGGGGGGGGGGEEGGEGVNMTPVVESTPSAKSSGGTSGTISESPHAPSPESPFTPPLESPFTPPLESPSPPSTAGEEGENSTSISWEKEFFPAITETTLQLRDMNGDGVSDVVMVEGVGACDMVVHALDGESGETVWSAHLTYDPFALKCDVDLNKDDIIDCIAAGRSSGFRAISGADGSTLWDRDPRLAYIHYNFYFPLFVPDLDGDGVQDIINTHGGDSTYGDEERERSPSFLVAVSGRTGQQMMERVPVPDGHETYMSPVYLRRAGEGDMIVVGTGGETLPGSLWAIGYTSLQTRVSSYITETSHNYTQYAPFTDYVNHPCKNDVSHSELERQRPQFDPAEFDTGRDIDEHLFLCPSWGDHHPVWNKYVLCVYQLLSTEDKGVMLPPVVTDMTGDLQEDLVVSTFEGRTLVINGEDGKVVWEVMYPGTESYSIPAPLFFNTDNIPDLVIRINHGVWSIQYNLSTIAILDGRNGNTLWSLDSGKAEMMSCLSLAGDSPGGDAAVFIAVGTGDEENTVIRETREGHQLCLESGVRCWDEEGEEEEGRERRHNGPHPTVGEAVEDVEEEDDSSGSSAQYEYDNFMDKVLAYRDPAGLWDGAGDKFPDPHTDITAFLDYCGWTEKELSASLYVLPRQQILTGAILPLFSHGPRLYFPGTQKRHGGDDIPSEPTNDLSQLSPEAIQQLRCGHVQVPDMIVSTPAIGDLNSDGLLEIVYTVSWGGTEYTSMQSLPPRFSVYVTTVEERVREVFGEEGIQWAKTFLPAHQQPWKRYMGTDGDNVYHRLP